MKVLFIYHFLPDYREGVFQALLDDQRITATFVAGQPGGEFGMVPIAESIPCVEVKNRWWANLLWQSGVLPMLWRADYDAVVFRGSWWTVTTWLGSILARLRGKRVYFWQIGWRRRERGIKRWFRNSYNLLPHALMLYGNLARDIAIASGFPPERLHVIGNSIPIPDRAIDTIAAPQHSTKVLWVSRLLEYKHPEWLLQAIAEADRRGHDIECDFVGAGDAETWLAQAASLGIADRVRFHGRLAEPAVASLADQARVFAIPAHAGLSIATALSYGVPVIVNNDAAANPPEWEFVTFEGQTGPERPVVSGSAFPPGDIKALADELIRWCIEAPASTEQRQAIARTGREIVSPYRSADAIVAVLLGDDQPASD